MTEQFYSLEEAAEQLKFSETILVRLSQYFKIPRAAYDDVGYLSFKGDLAFSESELLFFQQAKDRLVLGESLDSIKKRLSSGLSLELPAAAVSATGPESSNASGFSQNFSKVQAILSVHAGTPVESPALGVNGPTQTLPEAGSEIGPPLNEIQDRTPYEKAAEKSFERYKSRHRSGLGKVFENILKEVGPPEALQKLGAAVSPRAPKGKSAEGPEVAPGLSGLWRDAVSPFLHRPTQGMAAGSFGFDGWTDSKPAKEPQVKPYGTIKSKGGEAVWEPLIQQAAQKPRSLNTQLKSAATRLRERAVGQPSRQDGTPR